MQQIQINYADDKSLFIVNQHGKIKQLFVPIRAKCIASTGAIYVNSYVYIEQVNVHLEFRIVYMVFGKWHPYFCFTVV